MIISLTTIPSFLKFGRFVLKSWKVWRDRLVVKACSCMQPTLNSRTQGPPISLEETPTLTQHRIRDSPQQNLVWLNNNIKHKQKQHKKQFEWFDFFSKRKSLFNILPHTQKKKNLNLFLLKYTYLNFSINYFQTYCS